MEQIKRFNIQVEKPDISVSEEISIAESVCLLVKNLTVKNLKLLATKSNKKGINEKLQKYKHLI